MFVCESECKQLEYRSTDFREIWYWEIKCIIIIFISKTILFDPQPSLEDFCQTLSTFHFFGICNNDFFTEQVRQAFRPTPKLEVQVPVFMSPGDRVAQLDPQAPRFHSVAFYDSQGCGEIILTRLHTGTVT
jgi:hypothetical protein